MFFPSRRLHHGITELVINLFNRRCMFQYSYAFVDLQSFSRTWVVQTECVITNTKKKKSIMPWSSNIFKEILVEIKKSKWWGKQQPSIIFKGWFQIFISVLWCCNYQAMIKILPLQQNCYRISFLFWNSRPYTVFLYLCAFVAKKHL